MPFVDAERELQEEIGALTEEQREWFAEFVDFFDKKVAPFGLDAQEKLAFLKNKSGSLFFSFDERRAVSFAEAHFLPVRRDVFVQVCRGTFYALSKSNRLLILTWLQH